MAEQGINLSPTRWFSFVIAIIAVTNIAILLDIPILRQISGFIFLTFIPGFLLLLILKLNKLGLAEKIVLSVGLSLTLLMFSGLALNGLLLAIGYSKPLSIASLLISLNTTTIILVIIAYMRNKDTTFSFSNLKLSTGEKAFLIVPSLFPLLSIVGMRIMNLTDNNIILMLLLFLIPAYVIFISFFHRRVPDKVYPFTIFLIGISLLLMYSLRSNHIIGSDTHREFFMFMTVVGDFQWSQMGFGALDACLSISILPAIYQLFLDIDPEYLFKLFYSVIVSILPLAVYLLSKRYIGSFYAFLASVFFMSQIIFLWTPSYARTNTAILFFGLAILVMFHDGISEFDRKALFIIFSASTIVSHYGTTYVAFFVVLLTWIGMQIISSIVSRKKELAALPAENRVTEGDASDLPPPAGSPLGSDTMGYKATALGPTQAQLRRGITITVIALFLAMLFFWYSQMTGPSFSSGVRFIYNSFTSWEWFLTEEAVGQPVPAAFGKTLPYIGAPQRIEFVVSWLTIFFIAIGILTTVIRFKAMVSSPYAGYEKPNFLLKKFEAEHLLLSIMCSFLLVAMVILPFVSKYYGLSKTYFQMVVPLSIFFVIGGIMVAKYLKARPHWVILAVLIPYFWCTTGVMTQVFGFPRAITLNSEGILYNSMYVSDEESYAAKWVKEHAEGGVTIYTQGFTKDVLTSQGKIPYPQINSHLISDYEEGKEIDGYIYLRYSDINSGLVAEYPGIFAEKSKIYSSGGSEVYK